MKFPIHVCTAENFLHYLNYNFVNNVKCFYMKTEIVFSHLCPIYTNGGHYNSLNEADQK